MPAIAPVALAVLALTVGDGGVLTTSGAPAPKIAANGPCSSAEHRQFDFWLGEYEVREEGRAGDSNRVTRTLGGCALREEWSESGTIGTSLDRYDASKKRWYQIRVDDKGNVLLLAGGWKAGRMVLEGERPASPGATTRERLSWMPMSGGRVRQLWESSGNGGKTWQTTFDQIYTPKRS